MGNNESKKIKMIKLLRNMFNQETLNKYDGALKAMIDNVEIPEKAKTIEMGCIHSEMSCILQKIGCEAWGVDVKDWDFAWGDRNFKYIAGNFQLLDLPKDYFDVAIDICAMHHFGIGHYGDKVDVDADIRTSEKVHEILKPNGIWYSTFDKYWCEFIPNKENLCRCYSLKEFKKRICERKFEILESKFYMGAGTGDPHEIKETKNEVECKILYVKMQKT